MSVAERTNVSKAIARVLLRTPRDVIALESYVDQGDKTDRGVRAAQSLLAVDGIPWPVSCPLSPNELEVLRRSYEGLSTGEVAFEMGVAMSTVRTHLYNAYRKLDVNSRAQAIIHCYEQGWL